MDSISKSTCIVSKQNLKFLNLRPNKSDVCSYVFKIEVWLSCNMIFISHISAFSRKPAFD